MIKPTNEYETGTNSRAKERSGLRARICGNKCGFLNLTRTRCTKGAPGKPGRI